MIKWCQLNKDSEKKRVSSMWSENTSCRKYSKLDNKRRWVKIGSVVSNCLWPHGPGSSVHGILQQEYWSGYPLPSTGELPNPGNEPGSPALQADSLPSEPPKVGGKCDEIPHWGDNYLKRWEIEQKRSQKFLWVYISRGWGAQSKAQYFFEFYCVF